MLPSSISRDFFVKCHNGQYHVIFIIFMQNASLSFGNCVKSIWHITTSVFNLSVRMWKINLSKILIDSICVWFSGSTMFHFGWLKRFSNHRWAVTVRKSWIILSMWPKNVTIWTIYIQNMPSFQPYKAPQFFASRKLGIYWVNGTKMYLTNCMNYSVKNPISRNYGSI